MELELVLRTRREGQRGRAPVERRGRRGGENLERPRCPVGAGRHGEPIDERELAAVTFVPDDDGRGPS